MKATDQFFPDSGSKQILSDISCEPFKRCNRDQITFKAYYSSWISFMSLIVPAEITTEFMAKIKTSAVAAGQQCSGGDNGKLCGIRWTETTKWDGTSGVEQQMAVLGVLNAVMVPHKAKGPYNAGNGGKSESNPHGPAKTKNYGPKPISAGDRAGAGILTATFLIMWLGAVAYMIRGN